MNPLPTVGLKTLIIFGLSFVKQLAHGLIKKFAGYVTLLNAFVLGLFCIASMNLTGLRLIIQVPVGPFTFIFQLKRVKKIDPDMP